MEQLINAQGFFKAWKLFIEQKYPDTKEGSRQLHEDWQSNSAWTKAILGSNEDINQGSPFGDWLRKYFGEPLSYQLEFFKIDLVFSTQEKIRYINYYGDEVEAELYWPEGMDILIEHENVIEASWEEMIKLTYFRAPLKVLITYIPDKLSGEDLEFYKRTANNNFTQIVKRANSVLPENPSVEYLLIIGSYNPVQDTRINWDSTIIRIPDI
jgi:hypothetical protein